MHLKQAEERYLDRKNRELFFTNRHYELFGVKARTNPGETGSPVIQYPNIQAYRRMELRKRGAAAIERLWELAGTHHFYRLVLNVRSTPCRLHHARRLQEVRSYIWRRIGKIVTGYVRSLHLDKARYPHWDHVLAIPSDRENAFNEILTELNRQIYNSSGPGDVRIWTRRILHKRLHLEKTIDYSLRTPRYDRDPAHPWLEEGFRSDAFGQRLGIARRRIIRCREFSPVETYPGPADAKPKAATAGRPRKSDGRAYRQRRRRRSDVITGASYSAAGSV
jgi:hypothetical protein